MDRTERFYKIRNLLSQKGAVSFAQLMHTTEVSRATLNRDLAYLRDRMNLPIIHDREAGGYRLQPEAWGAAQRELPGLWFNSKEIHALLTMQHLLTNLDSGGILTAHIQPLMVRLNALMGTAKDTTEEIRRRVMIVGMGKRTINLAHFEYIGSALLRRQRLFMVYHGRSRNQTTEREVSPQRLVYYRENWYLDAWCHLRQELRNFSVDAIQHAEVLDKKAREIPGHTVDAVLGPGYGIFSGKRLELAKLRFTPERARWVAHEHWHPQQKGQFDPDGSYLLEIPYADDRELLMDILKYGADVEVLSPSALRERVQVEIEQMAKHYD